ncbi:MAG: mandelate racemase/muconate lactonizing enzyme family protein [Planctomycetaceae bacterium]|nr:mandelate racemase/muconate lactonizing enzyme family protein [Planctomycetaceae bacterium]
MPEFAATRRRLLQSTIGLTAASLLGADREVVAAEKAAATPLKITAVTSYSVKTQLTRPFGVSISVPLDATRTALFVKIETDAGIVGWGETAPIGGVRGAIDDALGPMLIGRNPLEYRALTRDLWGANFYEPLAIGALDTAINDIRGKALGMPVAELFGGRLRSRVPAYASAMNYLEGEEPENQFPREAAELVERGFKAMKMRLGRYSVAREARVAEAVRDVVGPDVKLLCDANAAYTLRSALDMGEALNDLGFILFEEPLPQSPDYTGYPELRERLPLPLAGGEALGTRNQAKSLLERRGVDIIQPDVSLCGGIPEVLFIAEMAALHGVPIIPHCWGGAVLLAATTHLLSLLPDPHWGFPTDTPLLEFDQSENPWRTEIVKTPLEFKDGFMTVPTGPGLGIEIDEAAVRKYAV